MSVFQKGVNFYRRVLPSGCVALQSNEGITLFTESLLEGGAKVFFKLVSQFVTQDDPAFCGISTLVMVLNALGIDPGIVWKGSWRWYHENMLDCCVPLEVVKTRGIAMHEFGCLAKCNQLDSQTFYASADEASCEKFRETLKNVTCNDHSVLVVSYNRKVLDQTGSGHFSPVGAFHEGKDMLLIMDVARFKYSPHWVSVERMWKAMQSIDSTTGLSRGYFNLMPADRVHALILFGVNEVFLNRDEDALEFLERWFKYLLEDCQNIAADQDRLRLVLAKLIDLTADLDVVHLREPMRLIEQDNGGPPAISADEPLRQTRQLIKDELLRLPVCQRLLLLGSVEEKALCLSALLYSRIYYIHIGCDRRNSWLNELIELDLQNVSGNTHAELWQLGRQLGAIYGKLKECCTCKHDREMVNMVENERGRTS